MNIFNRPTSTRRLPYYAGLALMVATVAIQSVAGYGLANAEGNDTLYIVPGSNSYAVGQSFTVQLRENSNAEQVNAVQADISYSSELEFASIDVNGSAFGVDAQKTGGNGLITIARGSTTPVTGDKLIAYIKFNVVKTGTGTVTINNSSVVVSQVGNKNVVDTRTGGSFRLNGVVTPTSPGPPGPVGPPGPTGPAGRPAPIPTTYPIATPTPGAKPNVSIVPNPTPATPIPQPTILPQDSEIIVDEPSTLETTPSDSETVQKVEYYIDGKLIKTVTDAPYSYSVDVKKMKNGTYKLTTKTYYEDGKVDSVDSSIVVKNPLTFGQMLAQYAWLIILLLVLLAGAVWFMFFRNRGGGGGDEFGGGYGDEFSGQPPAGDNFSNPYGQGPPPPNAQILPQGPPPSDQQFMPQDPTFGNPALGNPGANAMPPDLNPEFPLPPTGQDQQLPPNDQQINRF